MNDIKIETVNGLAPIAGLVRIRDGKIIQNKEMIKKWNKLVLEEEEC